MTFEFLTHRGGLGVGEGAADVGYLSSFTNPWTFDD